MSNERTCQVQNLVYKSTVSATPNFPKQVYLGVAEDLQPQKVGQEQKL